MEPSSTIEHIQVSVYTVPTETPESEGTFQWNRTSLVLVEVFASGGTGLGYSYADTATAHLIEKMAFDGAIDERMPIPRFITA